MKIDISIIIPVLNEQETINKTIEKLYHQDFKGFSEIIVVDGSKDKNTLCCIEDTRVITLSSKPGRGDQMNMGARKALGDTLLFLHCDTTLPENALTDIQNTMKNRSVKAGAFDLSINGKNFFYRMIEKTASLRSRMTKLPYGDQAIFIQKTYFFDMGQYRKIPIMEDIDLMKRIKHDNGKLVILKTRVITSSRRWEDEGMVYCTLRNWVILTLFLFGVYPEKLAKLYKPKSSQG
ncbi:MAG: glycosyltransferase family 2 protein [Desulfobacteraceae bacterium]|nr:glycosyltransferase family 2 protein [Desulfobacteraceae bacterium]